MVKEVIVSVNLERLNDQINELREALNEICAAADETKSKDDILVLSQLLDELIVRYMNQVNRGNYYA